MKYFLSLFLLNIFTCSWATDTVRLYDVDNLVVTAITNSDSYTLNSSEPSGDATSSSAPATVYIPMTSTVTSSLDAVDNTKFFKLNTSTKTYDILKYSSTSDYSSTHYITLPLKVTSGTSAMYLYAAVRYDSDTAYKVIKLESSSGHTNTTDETVNMSISPDTICGGLSGATTNCSNFDLGSSQTENVITLYTYYFLNSSSTLANSTIDPTNSSYSNGVYFKLILSNTIYPLSELKITLDSLNRGDNRVTGSYTNNASMGDYYKETFAFVHSSSAGCSATKTDSCNSTSTTDLYRAVGTCSGTLMTDAVATSMASDFTLASLTNGCTYLVSIGTSDKFGFLSTLSNSILGQPTDIEELLKGQQCYLLTAGFGEEHFIIKYFRHFRDTVLEQHFLGKKFVHLYYSTAPYYAHIIYKHEWMRFGIRMSAYLLYFLFNYFVWLALPFLFIMFLILRKNKKIVGIKTIYNK
jgi:hypothetical protein